MTRRFTMTLWRWAIPLLALLALPAAAQETPAEAPAEAPAEPIAAEEVTAIVTKVERACEDAFGRGDAPWMASSYTDTATIQTESGTVYKGRAAIEKMMEGLVGRKREGEILRSEITVSTALTPDIIVSNGVTFRVVPGTGASRTFYMRVYMRRGDDWLIAASHSARPGGIQIPLEDDTAARVGD